MNDRFRYTAYSDTGNGTSIPVGHDVTLRKAVARGKAKGYRVTHAVLRRREYPFTHLRKYDVR